MFARKFGDGSRRPASEITDGIGDRHGLSARALIGAELQHTIHVDQIVLESVFRACGAEWPVKRREEVSPSAA